MQAFLANLRGAALALAITTAMSGAAHAQAAGISQSPPAQETRPDEGSGIIVDGERPPPATPKQVLAYVNAVMMEEPEGQYAKFGGPICPSAHGFNEELTAFIEQRILALAKAAQIDTAKRDCRPNIHLMIVADGPSAIKELRQRGRTAFGRMRPYERDRIERGEGPVYKWHLINPLADDGNQNRASGGAGMANDAGSEEGFASILDNEGWNVARTNTKSRILKTVRQGISHAFIVIEKDAIISLSPIQIADYTALMALARITEGEAQSNAAPSIRTLFTQPREDAMASLSDWDLALLKSLYKVRGNLRASQQRAAMTRSFRQVLKENRAAQTGQ